MTKKGTRCTRSGEPYCWQHGGSSRSSSSSSVKTSPSKSSNVKLPKSYQVYQQRKTQGPRNFTPAMRQKMYQKCGGICAHCHKRFPLSEMDADHIKPYSKGGKTEESNCQMLCKHCNRSKGNRYEYWVQEKKNHAREWDFMDRMCRIPWSELLSCRFPAKMRS